VSSELKDLDPTELLLEAMRLKEKVKQFELDRVAVRKAIRDLDMYVVVQKF